MEDILNVNNELNSDEVACEEATEEVAAEEVTEEAANEEATEEAQSEETTTEEASAEEETAEEAATEDAPSEETTTEEASAEGEITEEAPAEEVTNEEAAEETVAEAVTEEAVAEEASTEEVAGEAKEEESSEDEDSEEDSDEEEEAEEAEPEEKGKQPFKLTLPDNFEELTQKVCCKRGRKLIYKPNEVIFEGDYKVIGTDKKNEEGIKVKDIIDAEIKEGLKQGYLDKFDGLKTSEIKEEYENDVVYELAEQEFRKMGIIVEDGKIKVYLYDWDRKGMHHVGYLDSTEAQESIKYFEDKENYSFDLCGIITGGKAKRVTKDETGKFKITKEKGDPIGIELDVTIVKRKD